MTIRVGIIGLGKMGQWHARQALQQPGFALHSVFDVTAARRRFARDNLGCAVHARLDSFLDDSQLDLVVVATPSSAHVGPTIAALRAGKHCLVEKPMCTSAAQAERMIAAARKARRSLVVFQNRRLDDYFLTTRKVVESGRLGKIYDLRFVAWNYSRLMQTFGVPEFRPQWRSKARYGGGVLFDFGAHYLDQLLLLCPQPIQDVYGDLRARRWSRDADDHFLAIVRFADGAVAQVETSHSALVAYGASWTINGSDAGYQFANGHGTIYWRSKTGQQRARTVKAIPTCWDRFYRQLRAHLRGAAPPPVRLEQSLRLMKLLDAVRRSARTARLV
ncbi:MAG: Gfo/Idh/MocA family protein, partial [Phycisphaerae bacterium]